MSAANTILNRQWQIRWDRRLVNDRRRHQVSIHFPDRRSSDRRQTGLDAFLWQRSTVRY